MTKNEILALARRKLGPGATVRTSSEGFVAEYTTPKGRTRVTAHDADTLAWFLEQMPERTP